MKSFDSVKSRPIPSYNSWSTHLASEWIPLCRILQKVTKDWERVRIKKENGNEGMMCFINLPNCIQWDQVKDNTKRFKAKGVYFVVMCS